MALSAPVPSILQELALASQADPEFTTLLQRYMADPTAFPDYTVKDEFLLFKGRLRVPHNLPLRHQLLTEFHSSAFGGHSGVTRTYQRLSATFYWKQMRADVKDFVSHCQICQQTKPSFLAPSGLLQPLPIPQAVFEDIAMDFITCLPVSQGKTVIMKEMHRINGTTLKFSTAYHPQTDGQSEALNHCLEMYLRCYVTDYPHKRLHFLPWAEFWYNTSYQTSSQMTPFEILYGRKPPTLTRYLRDSTTNTTLEEQFLERDNVLTLLKTNLLKAQSRMKLAADKHRKDVHFLIDDWVYVKLQPYRQGSVRLRRHHKLGRRYFGPYRIIAKIGEVAYKLDLPATTKIHPVFHVSLLRKCIGKPVTQITPLHLVDSTSSLILQPQKVLQTRTVYKGTHLVPQSLIQWEGLHVEDAT
ncbi:hypothetical protein L1987_79809 [Smallanthus sonchifolius]|uniref:Uncharacterized protein n=1 Tax=Smallanthus sonchifolius TaxID=185202 RepID=A0ACB8YKZ9_9ASTR|nr:hypothetical protein L1987_79809 [Smallanthus sonchifolius]